MSRLRFNHLWHATLQPRSAWLGALMATSLSAGGMAYQHQVVSSVAGMPEWQSAAAALTGLIAAMFLVWRRKRISVRTAVVVYLVNVAVVIATLAYEYPFFAAHPEKWVPFQASKLGCLIGALLAPSFPAGLLAIAGHAGTALWIYWSLPLAVRDRLAYGEPGAMIIFGVAGLVILSFRFSQVVLEKRMYAANTTLRFRDLMNTPLQTLDLGIALLKHDAGTPKPDPELLARMSRAVDSLRDINGLLIKHEKSLDWTPPSK